MDKLKAREIQGQLLAHWIVEARRDHDEDTLLGCYQMAFRHEFFDLVPKGFVPGSAPVTADRLRGRPP